MQCARCGAENPDYARFCGYCGTPVESAPSLSEPGPAPSVTASAPPPRADSRVAALIPTGNPNALVAYYLGVFSLVPCFGLFIGIPALVLGLKGRRYALDHPEAYGKVHAWVGILAGGIFGTIWIALTIVLVVATLRSRS